MLKRLSSFLVILLFLFCSLAFADMPDKATLGGIDSSGNYHWRVDASGDLVPGTTSQNDIGDSTHKVDTVYSGDVATSTVTATGNLTFKSTLNATGIGSSGATSFPTTASTNPAVNTFSMLYVTICTRTITIQNGYAGQILTFVAVPSSDMGTTTITAQTKTAWTSAAMDTVGDTLTLLYIDDIYGWVVVGTNSVTIT